MKPFLVTWVVEIEHTGLRHTLDRIDVFTMIVIAEDDTDAIYKTTARIQENYPNIDLFRHHVYRNAVQVTDDDILSMYDTIREDYGV